jgi:Zn-dependent peptidase ImmA (M78 family)
VATDLSNLEAFFGEQKQSPENNICARVTDNCKCYSIPEIMEKVKELKIETEPLDIRKVVEKIFQIDINETDLGRSASGFLERIGNKWCIYINKYDSEVRKRFTIAHELGHFVYHRSEYVSSGTSIPDQIFFRDDRTNPIEREANEFAANLLMPVDKFNAYIDAGLNTVGALADKFQLSTSAIKYRAYKLGLISSY